MLNRIKYLIGVLSLFIPLCTAAQRGVVNIYAWTGEIPEPIIQQFEKETGIQVNFSEYENNEIMYTKLHATTHSGYDVIMPSSNLVDRMIREKLIEPLHPTLLSNWKNIHPQFLNPPYDPHCRYSVPFAWGTTGIFINPTAYPHSTITAWRDLWQPAYHNQLLLLDDMRDVFGMALLKLGFSINDRNTEHIRLAFLQLKALMPNVKMFSTETVTSMIIDEDATIGMIWNGDAVKAAQENKHIQFIYPTEGFPIWIDSFAIPRHAPHPHEAYQFINFILKPEIAKQIALETGYPIANIAGQRLLPQAIQHNPIIYPPQKLLKHGQYTLDLDDKTLAQYEHYWEELKMGG